jgi:polysaccharide pyruvyl transferase WcaK-like protein
LDKIQSQDVFLGVKLHSIVFSFCVYTPALAIEYQPKIRDFMSTMDMNDYMFRSDSLSVDELYHKINAMYSDIEAIQKKQFEECQEYRGKIIGFRDDVYRYIGLA